VVSAAPGRKTTKGRDHRAQAWVGEVVFHRERGEGSDAERSHDRQQDLQRRLRPRRKPQRTDDQPEQCRREDVTQRRMQDQRDPDRQDAVPGNAGPRPEARPQLADLLQTGQPVGRLHTCVLGVVGQPVQHRDLIQPHRGRGRSEIERRTLAAAERDEQ
jgi:hypothetical protein